MKRSRQDTVLHLTRYGSSSDALGRCTSHKTLLLSLADIMKSKSNPDFMKKQSKQSRGVRSKVSVEPAGVPDAAF